MRRAIGAALLFVLSFSIVFADRPTQVLIHANSGNTVVVFGWACASAQKGCEGRDETHHRRIGDYRADASGLAIDSLEYDFVKFYYTETKSYAGGLTYVYQDHPVAVVASLEDYRHVPEFVDVYPPQDNAPESYRKGSAIVLTGGDMITLLSKPLASEDAYKQAVLQMAKHIP